MVPDDEITTEEPEAWVALAWVGDGSRSVPGLPMGDVTLPAAEAAQMLRTGLWVVAQDAPPAAEAAAADESVVAELDAPVASESEAPTAESDAPVVDEPTDPLLVAPEMPA